MANFDARQVWTQIPYFNKRIVAVSTLLYLLSFFTSFLTLMLVNIPFLTVAHFQVHRLITTIFVNISKFNPY
jgi:uncharacterized membrane-anchored protein YitT (DUF2179 family)